MSERRSRARSVSSLVYPGNFLDSGSWRKGEAGHDSASPAKPTKFAQAKAVTHLRQEKS